MIKEKETKGRMLTDTQIGKYTLLNSEKLGRALDMLEGIVELKGDEVEIVAKCKDMKHEDAVLSLYDRVGGAVKIGERKLATGTFFDFAAREPKVADIKESDFADEFVLVRKKTVKGKKSESVSTRIKRLESKVQKGKEKAKEAQKAKET